MLSLCFGSGFYSTAALLRRDRETRASAKVCCFHASCVRSVRRLLPGVTRGPRSAVVPLAALLSASGLLAAGPAQGTSAVRGVETTCRSPGGAVERCVALAHLPGGEYSAEDLVQEKALCAIDFYGTSHGLCRKVCSTSPATP